MTITRISNNIMNSMNTFGRAWLIAALITLGLATAQAQTPANWIGPASGGEWNTAANWDTGAPPLDSTTNAFVGPNTNVSYNIPMSAASFGSLAVGGILNINTSGFNCAAATVSNTASRLFVTGSGVLGVTGNVGLFSSGVISLSAGSSVNIGGTLTFGGSVAATAFGIVTNNGGTLTAAGLSLNPNNASVGTSSRYVILGGTNNLGAINIQRSPGGNSAPPTLGTDGLVISNGFVNATSISLGNNAHSIIFLINGFVTNSGNFIVKNATPTRPARFLQTGGFYTGTSVNAVSLAPTGNGDVVYSVLGGTNQVIGLQLGTLTSAGTIFMTNAATIFIGSGGIATNGTLTGTGNLTITNNIWLNTGGRFAASADWTNMAPINMSGGSFDAQDAAGVAHNIYSSGALRSSGALNKTGPGTLTLTATNTYTGATTISAGTLALAIDVSGSVGSIATSSPITVASNAIFDVSQISGMVLGSSRTLAGGGTVVGTFAAGPASNISPAGSGAQGTLTFANSLGATNANFRYDLTDSPTLKTNDFIKITGDLNVDGTNNIIVTPVTTLAIGTYKLIKFTGNLNGGITNFACTSGTLTNPPGSGEINLIVAPSRGPATLAWRGDGSANLWDTAVSSNWLNGVTRDLFLSGDTVNFDNGATNFLVALSGILSPAAAGAVTVNSTNDYAFVGGGDISGSTGLTKTNSGKLSISAINDYVGVTTIAGGTLSVSNLANGGSASPIGAAGTSSANLVFNGGTLEYLGANKTIDRGATILDGGSTLNVSNSGVTLTVSGSLTGTGNLTKTGSGQLTLTGGNSYSGGTVVNAGILRANPTVGLGTNLTLNGGATAATFQFAGDAQTLSIPLNVIGNNNFLIVGGNDTVNALTGNGTVKVDGTGTQLLTYGAADMSAFTGTILWDTVTTNRLFPNSGTSINAASTTFDLGSASGVLMNRDGGTYRLGALSSSSSTTELRGSNNSGSALTTYIIGEKNVDSTFAGIIRTGTGGAGARTVIVKTGIGKLTLTGANTYTGSTTVSNGVLALGDGGSAGSIGNSTNINIVAGAFVDVSGRIDGSLVLGVAQTLRGNGTVRGNLWAAGGTVSPGASIGTLTVTNSIILGGNVVMEINRAAVPNSDKLVSSLSTITYGGTLTVNNIGGGLQVGDTFTLFSGGGLAGGTFGTLALPNYYTWDTTQLGVNGTISVTAVLPGPSFSSIDGSNIAGGVVTLNASGGAPNGSYTVLTSTNAALPVVNWTPVTSGSFDGGGNLTGLGISVNPASPQQFYLLQVQ